MKRFPFRFAVFCLGAALLLPAARGQNAAPADPTRVDAASLSDVLKAQLEDFRSLRLGGLIAGADDEGIALLYPAEDKPLVIRPGTTFVLPSGGIPLRVEVAAVSEEGVRLSAPSLGEDALLPVSFTRSRRHAEAAEPAAPLRYVEFNRIPLALALRLLADQSAENFVATAAAGGTEVSLFLRGVAPSNVVEELCKSHGLWYRTASDGSGRPVTRVVTMEEFGEALASGHQEDFSETFTLRYPNVTEVASVIRGIYADRVFLSLGDADIRDDELDDLSRRFERFNVLNQNGSSSLLGDFNLNTSAGAVRTAARRNGALFLDNGVLPHSPAVLPDAPLFRDLSPVHAQALAEARAAAVLAGETNRYVQLLQDLHISPPSIWITASRRNNILAVRTTDPRVMDDIRAIVARLDVPTPMVLLEVKLLELALNDALDAGFDFTTSDVFHYGGTPPKSGTWSASLPAPALYEKGLTFTLIGQEFTSRLQLLREKGAIRQLATPTLLTANNEVSQLFIGKEVPIVKNVTSQTVVTDNNVVTTPETQVEFERVGTLLLITPNINADRTVTLRLLQENSDIAAEKGTIPVVVSNSVVNVDVDVVESRSISGTFIANDRTPIAIGGLIREEQTDLRTGVPFLMDIPLLGWFFRTTERTTRRNELIVLITPHVIATPTESEAATRDYLSRATQNPAIRQTHPGLPLAPDSYPPLRDPPADPDEPAILLDDPEDLPADPAPEPP
jgi:general secretion pathway protein D